MSFFQKVKMVPRLVLAGIQMYVNPPPSLKLELDLDYERRQEEERAKLPSFEGTPLNPRLLSKRKRVPIKVINLKVYDGKESWSERIKINLERHIIDETSPSPLLGRGHQGSGAMGVALFSSP